MLAVIPALLLAAAVALAVPPSAAPARLAAVLPPTAVPWSAPALDAPAGTGAGRRRGSAGAHRPGAPAAAPRSRSPAAWLRGPGAACVLAGLAVAGLLGGVFGAGAGLLVALAGPRVLQGLEPAADRQRRRRLAADLPMALDLLSACLTGGATLGSAVRAVAGAVPGPAGERLDQVASALQVGTPAAEAWRSLSGGEQEGLAASSARALVRASEGGAPVAHVVTRLADEARAVSRAQGEQAAERAGVLAVGPLGLCFLPAFVLLGITPVVLGLIGPVLQGL